MADIRALIAACLLAFSGLASAGYAQLTPPAGWTTGTTGGTSVGTLRLVKDAANSGQWLGKTVVTDASLNVGGRAITVPAALRLASNAGRFGAGVLFMNPWLRLGINGAAFLAGEFIYDEVEKIWRKKSEKYTTGGLWEVEVYGEVLTGSTGQEVCDKAGIKQGGFLTPGSLQFVADLDDPSRGDCLSPGGSLGFRPHKTGGDECPAGWHSTPAGCLSPAVSQPEFVDDVGPNAVPDGLPEEWPDDLPWPFELPKINPGPSPDFNPRPFFIPQGDPVPNPNYDPDAEPSPENQPYIRPGLNVKPANNDKNPWNVDLQPVDKPSPDDVPNPDPDMNPNPDGDKDKKPQDVGLCDLYPDILACAKFGQLEPVELPKDGPTFDITPVPGFGPSDGACPAPRAVSVLGHPLEIPFTALCDFATGIRPVVLAFAWLAAAGIFAGALRRS